MDRPLTDKQRSVLEFLRELAPSPLRAPCVGRGPPGSPREAIELAGEELLFDPSLAGEGEVFSLRVKGDSMEGAHICEGDYVLVRAQETAEDGEIVVAVVDGEATVKRIRRRSGGIRLEPANPAYAPVDVPNGSPSFRIAGKSRRLLRNGSPPAGAARAGPAPPGRRARGGGGRREPVRPVRDRQGGEGAGGERKGGALPHSRLPRLHVPPDGGAPVAAAWARPRPLGSKDRGRLRPAGDVHRRRRPLRGGVSGLPELPLLAAPARGGPDAGGAGRGGRSPGAPRRPGRLLPAPPPDRRPVPSPAPGGGRMAGDAARKGQVTHPWAARCSPSPRNCTARRSRGRRSGARCAGRTRGCSTSCSPRQGTTPPPAPARGEQL